MIRNLLAYNGINEKNERWNTLNERGHSSPLVRTISVKGIGEIETMPTMAELQITVRTDALDVTEAQRENAVQMTRVVQSLLALNIQRNDIQTSMYNVFPRYDYIEGRREFRGYEVTNSVSVTLRNIAQVGTVIDTAVKNGATEISQVQFKLENEAAHYEYALQLAMQHAWGKACAIAESLGLSYPPTPVEVIEESVGGPILFKTAALTETSFETPIEPGMITIKAEVTVKYQY